MQPFNRTSMELKLGYEDTLYFRFKAFNRTSMELKHAYAYEISKTPVDLLIEPVWN